MIDRKHLFNVAVAGLLIAAPALAANTTSGAPGAKVPVAAKCDGGACEKGGGGHWNRGGGHHMDLSDAQLEKMSTLRNKFLDSTASQRTELETLYRQMKGVFTRADVDRNQALEIQSKINATKANLATARLNLKLEELSVLTPDQREKLRHRMLVSEAFGGFHHGGPGRFGHGGPAGFGHGGPGQMPPAGARSHHIGMEQPQSSPEKRTM